MYEHRNAARKPLAAAVLAVTGSLSLAGQAQTELEEVVVVGKGDYFSILPDQPTDSAFGLDMTIAETPRSISEVREDLIQKFALRSVDDLVRLTPGAFTSSFFGIKGAMDIRGEPADNYFRGFRRIANPGAFNTIVGGAERLEILRGPVSPLYGTGSIGGQLNYIPKSAKSEDNKYIAGPSGQIKGTYGSYNQRVLTGEFGMPFTLGDAEGGVQLFAEVEDSESYFDDYEPSHELVQLAFDIDLSYKTKLEFGVQYQETDSIQVPGWNRVTQELIDNGTYITGSPPSRNSNGGVDLRPNESGFISAGAGVDINNSFSGVGTFCVPGLGFNTAVYNGREITCFGGNDTPWISPLSNVGTTKLDHDTTFIDSEDFADTTALTAYFDVTHTFDNDMVWKNQFFYDYMDHTKYQSWGFTAFYPDADLWEFRTTLNFKNQFDNIGFDTVVGASYRQENLELNHAFFDETFDFRDISVGPTPDDRIAPATTDPFKGVVFETDADGNNIGIASGDPGRNYNLGQKSESDDLGIFFVSNINFGKFFMLVGARYDDFDIDAEETAVTLLNIPYATLDSIPDGQVSGGDDATSYNFSLSYRTDFGLVPYATYAESSSLSTEQLGNIIPASVPTSAFLQDSELKEIGVKFSGFDDRIYAALTYYDQEKTERAGQTAALVNVFSDGYEFEFRGVVNDNLSFLATATHSETTEIGNTFVVINGAEFAAQNGLNPEDVYGGRISGDRDTFTGVGAELERGGLPDNIVSLYGTWNQELFDGEFTASLGFTWVDETYTDALETIKLPDYMVWTGSLGYVYDRFSALLQFNNLTGEEYYTSADLFDSVVVKPSEGRTVALTLSYSFGDY
ncbi:TonB-dependent receptor plug domain-containing protein [Parahaliea maris]|uniref:TonB-dependent receptor plug domain-containing protein n=1 Tax=Parahaliea maris TaxID=2716870 RepID=A0A5C9A5L1_9GAMM|nr:TonB-dependent receptor plug domain-containing protein [Parahaliea maris]TXS95324.1 TonB-dependent receptor plug domain-containing protein [Parahaliea maris]